MIDKKKVFKCLIIISLIIIIIVAAIQIRNTLARYETTASTERTVEVAFSILDNDFKSERLLIEDVYPSTTPYEYEFTISNFEGDKIAETDLEYQLVITTTTNLPLSYELEKNGTTCTNTVDELYEDEYGTVYREIRFETTESNLYPASMNTIQDDGTGKYVKTKITDEYVLKVKFPVGKTETTYEYRENLEYADLMEDIKIEVSGRQVIGE